MLEQTRPHFFPGQLLDYRDFNRLSALPRDLAAANDSLLFQGGGILLQSLEEFSLKLGRELTVLVRPGSALLPSGHLLVLGEERGIDLQPYLPKSGQRCLIVGIYQETVGRDSYQDPEDPSIQGFRSQQEEIRTVVVTEKLPANALELFRVTVKADTSSLRFSNIEEDWSATILGKNTEAVIDRRFRRSIVPLTYVPVEFPELLSLRQAFYSMDDGIRRLKKIFLIEDRSGSEILLMQLHAEILSVPYQPLKMAYLVAEFAKRLSLFLESISRKCPQQQPNFERALYLEIIELLDGQKSRHVLPRSLPFEGLQTLAEKLDAFVRFAEDRFNLLNAVDEALVDLRDRAVGYSEKTTFAGHLFHRVDLLGSEDTDRVQYQSTRKQLRKQEARYESGDRVARTGMFVGDGKIDIEIRVPNTQSPAVVLFPQYLRRKSAKLQYLVNGKPLVTDTSSEAKSENSWRNRGLILPPETLVPQGNRITILLDEPDLDYGFFEAAVYQPTVAGGLQ